MNLYRELESGIRRLVKTDNRYAQSVHHYCLLSLELVTPGRGRVFLFPTGLCSGRDVSSVPVFRADYRNGQVASVCCTRGSMTANLD